MLSIIGSGPIQYPLRLDNTSPNEEVVSQEDQEFSSGSTNHSDVNSESDSSSVENNANSDDEQQQANSSTGQQSRGQVPLEPIVLQGKKKVIAGKQLVEDCDQDEPNKKKGRILVSHPKTGHDDLRESIHSSHYQQQQFPQIQSQQLDLTYYHSITTNSMGSNLNTPLSSLHNSPIQHHPSSHQQQLLTHYFSIQPQYERMENKNISVQNPFSSESQQPKRKRGRPPKKKDPLPDQSSNGTESSIPSPQQYSPSPSQSPSPSPSPSPAPSVRSIPCFYNNCLYSYTRPGSHIVEVSDRPLLIPTSSGNGNGWTSPSPHSKFENYLHLIRACKKHHDRWKSAAGTCEICRGLNYNNPSNIPSPMDSSSSSSTSTTEPTSATSSTSTTTTSEPLDDSTAVKSFTNNKGVTFSLCQICAERQSDTLGLNVPPSALTNNMARRFSSSDEIQGSPRMRRKKSLTNVNQNANGNGHRNHSQSSADSDESEGGMKEGDEGEDINDILSDDSDEERIQSRPSSSPIRSQQQSKSRVELLENGFDLPEGNSRPSSANGNNNNNNNNNMNGSTASSGPNIVSLLAAEVGSSGRESIYLESFKEIQQFNEENLTSQENQMSAFSWFLSEGHRIMKNKGKFTVPIENRLPAKKGMANNISSSNNNNIASPSPRQSLSSSNPSSPPSASLSSSASSLPPANKRKNMAEWGYVAQLERLDLERGREDCWVTFKPAKRWDYLAFLRALQTWYSMYGVPSNFKEISPAEWSAAAASSAAASNALTNSGNGSSRLAIQHKIIAAEPIKINGNNGNGNNNNNNNNSSNATINGNGNGIPSSPRTGPSPLVERRMEYKKRREMLPQMPESSSSSPSSSSSSTSLFSSSSLWPGSEKEDSTTTSSSSSTSSFPLLGVPFSENRRRTSSNSNDPPKCMLDEILISELTLSFSGNLLGKSNHGFVFKGYWKGLPVAVRFPTLKYPITETQMRDRWVKEINRSSKSHPNIVQYYAASTGVNMNMNSNSNSSTPITSATLNTSTQLFLVMEYCNLGSLRQFWPLAPIYMQGMYLARIAMDVARAVSYLHSIGIHHTNLKPSSIMLKGEMLEQGVIAGLEVKITDIALYEYEHNNNNNNGSTSNEESLPQITSTLENFAYMAPELLDNTAPTPSSAAQSNPYSHFNLVTKFQQFLGPPSATSTRSVIKPAFTKQTDVYAFGMVLCYLFSEGQELKPPAEVLHTSYYLQRWDARWKELITKCIHKNPEERPSFPEILDSLSELQILSRSV